MKRVLLTVCFYTFLTSCQSDHSNETTSTIEAPESTPPPASGTVLLSDSVQIPDPLNDLFFSVKLVAGEYTRQGTYDVKISYGHNNAETQLTFPRGGTERLIPKMQKGKDLYSYIIGFNYGANDPIFYEYYLIKATAGKIETKYLKSYTFK